MVKATVIKTICSTGRKLGQWHRGVGNRGPLTRIMRVQRRKRSA